jgi:hypothetical protein
MWREVYIFASRARTQRVSHVLTMHGTNVLCFDLFRGMAVLVLGCSAFLAFCMFTVHADDKEIHW